MNGLVVAEFERASRRRLVWVTAWLALFVGTTIGVVAFVRTSSANDAAVRQRIRARDVQEQRQRNELAKCVLAQTKDCNPGRLLSVSDPRFHRAQLRGILQGMSAGLALVAWVIGASLIGAEFQTRSMTTTL